MIDLAIPLSFFCPQILTVIVLKHIFPFYHLQKIAKLRHVIGSDILNIFARLAHFRIKHFEDKMLGSGGYP